MIELMKPEFDVKEADRRVGLRVEKWVNEFVCPLPNGCDDIVRNLTIRIVEYAGEIVENHGQESKFARSLYGQLFVGVGMIRDCGMLISDSIFDDFLMMTRDLVFDELRRCGVRTYRGSMEHVLIYVPPYVE